jgi:hypothetical protein
MVLRDDHIKERQSVDHDLAVYFFMKGNTDGYLPEALPIW